MQSMKSIGTGIGKRRCDVCVVDGRGRVLERRHYPNTSEDAGRFAGSMARRYGKSSCQAACETTGNMWMKTHAAFEDAGIRILLANTFKMATIAKTGKKTDRAGAEKIAQVLRMGMIPECHVPSAGSRTARDRLRQRARPVQDRTRVVNRLRKVSWAGLCPTIHQSGNQRYMGRMKKMDTDRTVNWTMIEAANVAVRHDPRMAAVYESARRRHADRHAQAIVVVAHKMITIAWHMLRTRTPYESRNEKMYLRKLDRMGKGRRS